MIIHFCHLSKAPKGIPVLHIQARPQRWVLASFPRSIPTLVPQGEEVRMMAACVQGRKQGADISALAAEYRRLYTLRVSRSADRFPDVLQDDQQSPITGEVACICTCSVAEARAGRCHRSWAAEVLASVDGWEVYIDGTRVSGDANHDYWTEAAARYRHAGDFIMAEACARCAMSGVTRP